MHHLTPADPLLPRSEMGRSVGRGVPKTAKLQPKTGYAGRLGRPGPTRFTIPHPPTRIFRRN
jgi:hypothetical protein